MEKESRRKETKGDLRAGFMRAEAGSRRWRQRRPLPFLRARGCRNNSHCVRERGAPRRNLTRRARGSSRRKAGDSKTEEKTRTRQDIMPEDALPEGRLACAPCNRTASFGVPLPFSPCPSSAARIVTNFVSGSRGKEDSMLVAFVRRQKCVII